MLLLQMHDAAVSAASALSRLWKQSAHAKLLQRPPAPKLSAKHAALIQQTADLIGTLKWHAETVTAFHAPLQKAGEGTGVTLRQNFLDDVLAARPVATLAKLLEWLQQQPELLQMPMLAAQEERPTGYGRLWLACTQGGVTHVANCYIVTSYPGVATCCCTTVLGVAQHFLLHFSFALYRGVPVVSLQECSWLALTVFYNAVQWHSNESTRRLSYAVQRHRSQIHIISCHNISSACYNICITVSCRAG
jgi:hypothetical protein